MELSNSKIFSKKSHRTFWPQLPKACSEKTSYIFLKKPPIFWKQKSPKNPYVSGNVTFLYFGK